MRTSLSLFVVSEPHGSIEYKYRLDKGQALLFSWSATAPAPAGEEACR